MVSRLLPLLFIGMLTACSVTPLQHLTPLESNTRVPAEQSADCHELVKAIYLKDNFAQDLEKALVEKKLLKFSNKFVTIQHPRLDWINRVRISFNKSLKNWNNNKYPAFYSFSDEDVLPHAKQYFETINSMITPDMAVAPEATKNYEMINSWMKAFENYQKDIDNLLEERISLQFNLALLKKLKIKSDVQDVKFVYRKNGKSVEEVVTIRKSDKDKNYHIKRLKTEITNMDGSLFKNGRIKERVIRQAMLMDMLTILQREFEYSLKNMELPNPELIKEFNRINELIATAEFEPMTYGVYRVTNSVFLKEVATLTRFNVVFKYITSPLTTLKEIAETYIHNRKVMRADMTEEEKIGVFKRIYLKLTNLTPKQVVVSSSLGVAAVIGYNRYFTLGDVATVEEQNKVDEVLAVESAAGHREQLERSKLEDTKRVGEHHEVIEVQIEELTRR